jgi:REP element-mobilizing transposase RayT
VGRRTLFDKEGDFLAFERVMEETLRTCKMRICGYCLMSNHWHFVVWPESDGELPTFMQQLTNMHVKHWKEHRREVGFGHLYQGRFKSFPVETDAVKRGLRWYQFRLKTLLVFVFVISAGLSVFMQITRKARLQRAAVLAIINSGGWVQYDFENYPGEKPSSPWLQATLVRDFLSSVTQVGLKSELASTELRNLPSVENIALEDSRNADVALSNIEGIESLTRVDLRGSDVTNDGLKHLKSLKNLHELDLSNTQVTNAGLDNISDIPIITLTLIHSRIDSLKNKGFAELKSLILIDSPITDSALADAPMLKRLLTLHLTRTKITDDGLKYLKGLALCQLDIDETAITDAGMVHIATLQNLITLNLRGTKVTDRGIMQLTRLKYLNDIEVDRTLVTQTGLIKLHEARERSLPPSGIR